MFTSTWTLQSSTSLFVSEQSLSLFWLEQGPRDFDLHSDTAIRLHFELRNEVSTQVSKQLQFWRLCCKLNLWFWSSFIEGQFWYQISSSVDKILIGILETYTSNISAWIDFWYSAIKVIFFVLHSILEPRSSPRSNILCFLCC